ncbi:hypothetical protein WA171_005614 [Blastocystis sp. BT1]
MNTLLKCDDDYISFYVVPCDSLVTNTKQLLQTTMNTTQSHISNLSSTVTTPTVSNINASSSGSAPVTPVQTDSSIPNNSAALSSYLPPLQAAESGTEVKSERKRSTRVVFSQKTKDVMHSLLSTLKIQYPNMTKKEMSKYIYHHLKAQGLAVGTYQSVLTWVYNNAKHQ